MKQLTVTESDSPGITCKMIYCTKSESWRACWEIVDYWTGLQCKIIKQKKFCVW